MTTRLLDPRWQYAPAHSHTFDSREFRKRQEQRARAAQRARRSERRREQREGAHL